MPIGPLHKSREIFFVLVEILFRRNWMMLREVNMCPFSSHEKKIVLRQERKIFPCSYGAAQWAFFNFLPVQDMQMGKISSNKPCKFTTTGVVI